MLKAPSLSRVSNNDNIYIGGIHTLKHRKTLDEVGITHIVSVLKYDFKNFKNEGKYEHLRIEVNDMEDVNLLEEFENSGAWIEAALKDGKDGRPGSVFVHCAMGISRSVTIVLAYLLRKNPELSVADALALVRQSRPKAHPNDGFMSQLELYKAMGFPRDIEAHHLYQQWIYQKNMDSALLSGNRPNIIRFRDEKELIAGPTETPQPDVVPELRCKKCRRILATSSYFVKHDSKTQLSTESLTTAQATPAQSDTSCTSHFVEALSWMRPTLEEGELKGRLICPNSKCSAQVGRYSWQGQRCSCNVWVCPSFSLQKSRCDEVLTPSLQKGDSACRQIALGIRYPPKV
ncbi:hypothetical protein K3495_g13368 [Podosphaera aphanis]|nr:hypothetical protein K3495_g13368 [Podosphaera aphanis]